ncbi:MAG: hypothetical protein U0002_10235 [Thermoanaerobaculia bacterium]
MAEPAPDGLILCAELPPGVLEALVASVGVRLVAVGPGAPIPGSWFGEPEAGLIGDGLYVRPDTPVHSALHELCHFCCMDGERRARLHTDAGGDYAEETAVCYLQILLGEGLPGFGRERAFHDMDAWGYSFRLGSAKAWFEQDAEDARDWLLREGLVDAQGRPTLQLRS